MPDPTILLPAADPIPLPAPVWLFKGLSYLTLTLHFGFLALLLSGLALAILWNWLGQKGSVSALEASRAILGKLPVLTTYVINLGVPPLLFAQVLYGRAFYTATVLMGAWWISVPFVLIGAYFLLYRMAKRAESGKAFWSLGLVSFALFLFVGRLYSAAMTSMLRPDTWLSTYATAPHGTTFPSDPAAWPRWSVVIVGSLLLGALGSSLWSNSKVISQGARSFLRSFTGISAIVLSPALALCGKWAWDSQSDALRQVLANHPTAQLLAKLWLAASVLSALCGLLLLKSKASSSNWSTYFALVPGLLSLSCFVGLRDIVRDAVLSSAGFDVWKSAVETNWTVVGLFLGSLVLGLVVMGWIASVVAGAKSAEVRA